LYMSAPCTFVQTNRS